MQRSAEVIKSRDDVIRTRDLLTPSQARYQAALRPDFLIAEIMFRFRVRPDSSRVQRLMSKQL